MGINVGWSNPCFEIWMFAYYGNMPVIPESSWTCCSKFVELYKRKTGQEYDNVCVNVFFADTDEMQDAHFRLSAEIAGRFRCENEWKPELEPNVLAIMFPYLRSIVSTITCNSGREPIILPTINIASLFEK